MLNNIYNLLNPYFIRTLNALYSSSDLIFHQPYEVSINRILILQRDSERLSDLPRVTQRVSGRGVVGTQSLPCPDPGFLTTVTHRRHDRVKPLIHVSESIQFLLPRSLFFQAWPPHNRSANGYLGLPNTLFYFIF